ncbi:MAG TPA: DUF2059 domain-containing protein [Caulobacteraceae bacterium]|nr:DUF2059 domain-containing protein [Caulobacteraceae bacterium]
MKTFAAMMAAVAVGVSAAGSSWAQSAASAQPDPAKLALAVRLQEIQGGQAQYAAQLRAMYEPLKASLRKTLAANGGELTARVLDDMEQEMLQLGPQLMAIGAKVTAQTYSEKELRDMITFEESDTGRAIIAKAALLRQRLTTEILPVVLAATPEIMRKTTDRVCEEVKCTADQRQIIASAMSKALGRPAS